jgi:hypothetical protein
MYVNGLVWCPGQNKRIAPLPFFYGCRKETKGLTALTSEIDCDQAAIGLPHHVCSIHNFDKTWASRRNICDAFGDRVGVVCMDLLHSANE